MRMKSVVGIKILAATCVLLAGSCLCRAQTRQGQSSSQTQQASTAQQNPPLQVAPAPQAPVHVDGDIMVKKLIHVVPPVYPQIAVMAHVSGTVVLRAIIATDGKVRQLTFISGPVLLMKAAMEAVRQWRFEPALLHGQPVEVETTIPVNFRLPEWQDTFKFKVTQPGSSRVILAENIDLGGSGKRQDWKGWIATFENATSRAWLAGTSSAASDKKGKVTVEFTLQSDGKIDGTVGVIHPSGNSAIDDATRLAIEKAAPFQALPPNPHYSSANVRITFAYDHPHALAPATGGAQ